MNQFDVAIDNQGNLLVAAGTVVNLTAATSTTVQLGETILSNIGNGPRLRTISTGAPFFIGGNGENMATTGTLSGTAAPIGYFQRSGTETWVDNFGNTIVGNDAANTAEIRIGTDVIATFSTAYTTAPVGTFSSTTFGKDTYNGGTAFTLTTTFEGGATASIALVTIFTGTAQDGNYTESGYNTWTNSGWTIDSTTGEIDDGTDIVATVTDFVSDIRDPTNTYDSTTYGADTYNAGAAFFMLVSLLGRVPMTGFVYVEIVLSAGAFSTARGPYFGTSLPANSSTLEVVPIAYSDGAGILTQFVNGAILYR
jgi:hypothetical protein